MTYTHSTNIWFSTSFEYFDIPLLRRCRITPCMRRRALPSSVSCCVVRCLVLRACSVHACVCACTVHAPCSVHACVCACSVLRVCMHRYASRCKVFYTAFFKLQVVFSLRFFDARRFFTTFFRCKAFLHCVFSLQVVFFTTFFRCKAFLHCVFSLQGVFPLCI